MFGTDLQQICNAVIEWAASRLLLTTEFIDQLECPLSPEVLHFYTHEYEEWLNSALLPSDPFRALTVDKVIWPEQCALQVHRTLPPYPHMARFVPLRRGLPTFLSLIHLFFRLSHGPVSSPNHSQVPGYMILIKWFDEVKILWMWFLTLAPKLESTGNSSSVRSHFS